MPKGISKDSDESVLKSYFFSSVFKNTYFNQHSQLGTDAKKMLKSWEEGDKQVVSLWKKMNSWVYEGFEATYKLLGVNFDFLYYE